MRIELLEDLSDCHTVTFVLGYDFFIRCAKVIKSKTPGITELYIPEKDDDTAFTCVGKEAIEEGYKRYYVWTRSNEQDERDKRKTERDIMRME